MSQRKNKTSRSQEEREKEKEDLKDVEPSVDEVAQRLREREDLCQTAFLGYGKWDLLEMSPVWGVYNKRPKEPSQAMKIMKSYLVHGVERYVPANRIPIILPRSWVQTDSLTTVVGKGGDDLPEIKWTKEADLGNIKGASGQHRFEGLKLYREHLVRELKGANRSQRELETMRDLRATGQADESQDDSDVETERSDELKTQTDEANRLKGELVRVGQWGFVLYDEGKLVRSLQTVKN